MPELDDNDIIIMTADLLKGLMSTGESVTINYETAVSVYGLPAGFEKHLEAAAEHAGMEIVLRGANNASVRKKPREPVRVVRS